MTNLDNILKSRDITLSTKVCLVKAMVFPVVMYGCENWTIKQTECQRTDAFELWCWTRLLRVQPVNPKGNQSWIFIGRTDAEAETPILKPPDAKSLLIEKDLDAEKDWRWEKGMTGDEMVGWHHPLNGMSLSKLWELVMDWEAWCAAVYGVAKVGQDWATELMSLPQNHFLCLPLIPVFFLGIFLQASHCTALILFTSSFKNSLHIFFTCLPTNACSSHILKEETVIMVFSHLKKG